MSTPPPPYEETNHLQSHHLRRPLGFDHNAPKYRHCFGRMHVQTAALFVAILSCFGFGFSTWVYYPIFIEHQMAFAAWLLWIPIIIFLFIGLFTKDQHLLVLYILYGIMMAIINIMISAMLIGVMLFKSSELKEKMEEGSGATMSSQYFKAFTIAVMCIILLLTILQVSCISWFTWIVFKCYQYFCDLKNYRGTVLIKYRP